MNRFALIFTVMLSLNLGCGDTNHTIKYHHHIDGIVERIEPWPCRSATPQLILYFDDGRVIPSGLNSQDGYITLYIGVPCRIHYGRWNDIRYVEKINPRPYYPQYKENQL